ncbi:MAG: hypothetical protein AABX28_01165 [Nanoarchaeota archaeon]
MAKEKGVNFIPYIIIAVVVLGIFGAVYYFYNEDQKSITANTISELERQLEEQGQLTDEQERQLEELAQVTCKEVQVPYDAQEAYTEQEPYADEVCENIALAYNKIDNYCTNFDDNILFDDEPAKYSVTINNLDSENGGWFYADIGFYIGEQVVKESQQEYIYPSSSATFYTERMSYIESCYFTITELPEKQECETVTKYQTITKYRTITKYKTETVCE